MKVIVDRVVNAIGEVAAAVDAVASSLDSATRALNEILIELRAIGGRER